MQIRRSINCTLQFKVFFGNELSSYFLKSELEFCIVKQSEKVYVSIFYNSLQYMHLLKSLSSRNVVIYLEQKNKLISNLIDDTMYECEWRIYKNSDRQFIEKYCFELIHAYTFEADKLNEKIIQNVFKVLWKVSHECRVKSHLKHIIKINFENILAIKNLEVVFSFII